MSPPARPVRSANRRRSRSSTAPRELFQQAFEKIGGVEALADWAKDKPTEFFRLFARLIPLSGEATKAGQLEVEIVRFSDPDEQDADDPSA